MELKTQYINSCRLWLHLNLISSWILRGACPATEGRNGMESKGSGRQIKEEVSHKRDLKLISP